MRTFLVGLVLFLSLMMVGDVATQSSAATPVPSTQALTYDDGVYIGRVLMTLNLFGASASRYSALSENPNPLDDEWTSTIGAEPRMWEALFDEFITIEPPVRFIELHEQLIDALEVMALTADDCLNGIENVDVNAVEACNAGVRESTALLGAIDLSSILSV